MVALLSHVSNKHGEIYPARGAPERCHSRPIPPQHAAHVVRIETRIARAFRRARDGSEACPLRRWLSTSPPAWRRSRRAAPCRTSSPCRVWRPAERGRGDCQPQAGPEPVGERLARYLHLAHRPGSLREKFERRRAAQLRSWRRNCQRSRGALVPHRPSIAHGRPRIRCDRLRRLGAGGTAARQRPSRCDHWRQRRAVVVWWCVCV